MMIIKSRASSLLLLVYFVILARGHSERWTQSKQDSLDGDSTNKPSPAAKQNESTQTEAPIITDQRISDIETSDSLLNIKSNERDESSIGGFEALDFSNRSSKISKQPRNNTKSQVSSNGKQHSRGSQIGSKITITATKTENPNGGNKDKKTKIKLFNKNPNFSLVALLPKSKRQDTFNTSQANSGNGMAPKSPIRESSHSHPPSLHHQPFEPILLSPLPSQTILHSYNLPQPTHSDTSDFLMHARPGNEFARARLMGPAMARQSHIGWTHMAPTFIEAPDSSQASSYDQNAVQSVDHLSRLLLKNQASTDENLPFLYPPMNAHVMHDSGLSNGALAPPRATNQSSNSIDNQRFSLFGSTNQILPTRQPSEPPISFSAAILGERAKALLSQLDLTNLTGDNSILRNNRSQASRIQPKTANQATDATGELAAMAKSAADQWASASTDQEASPTIIFEHDGPTMTTVDFGMPPVTNQIPMEPEEEDISSFYSEDSDETESDGSNEAKRVARLKQRPNPSSFYDNSELNDREFGLHQAPRSSHNRGSERATNFYPDSIKAVKERERDVRHKVGASESDQIERLIKDLQELKRKRATDSEENKRKEHSENAPDDYEDLLAANEEEDDEQIRMLRKKLMARLNSKKDRQRNKSAASDDSVFHKAAVKIPLHALLMAALDRRMSSSGESILVDHKDPRHELTDFGEDLGSLALDQRQLGNFTEPHISNPIVGLNGSKLGSSNSAARSGEDSLSPNAATSNQRVTPLVQLNISQSLTDSIKEKRHDQGNTNDAERTSRSSPDQSSIPTTISPTISSLHSPQATQTWPNFRRPDYYTWNEKEDFDLNRQVREFSNERGEPRLEPSWVSKQTTLASRGMSHSHPRLHQTAPHVDFDDEFDEMDRSTRRKLFKRRRLSPGRAKTRRRDMDRDEDRFLNRLDREIVDDDEATDIDKRVKRIEEPTENGSDSEESAREERQRPLKKQGEVGSDDEDEERDSMNEPEVKSGDSEFDADEIAAKRSKARSKSKPKKDDKWRPKVIDEEVRKLEIHANRQSSRKPHVTPRDEETLDDPDSSEEAETKLRVQRVTVPN